MTIGIGAHHGKDLLTISSLRKEGKRVVFTNGVFDLLHNGHLHLLSESRKFGDLLVVGINSDLSVKRLKGEARPVQNISDRMVALMDLPSVDFVLEFEEDTPIGLIVEIKPHVIVKGSDYAHSQIVGADFVTQYGGRVELVARVGGLSTTDIIKKGLF